MTLEWLNNNWVVGIGTGVISGLLVYLFTRILFASQSKKDFEQKVSAANRELILSIRPGIPEGEMPTQLVLRSLIRATSRKYNLKVEDVLTIPQITQDLIKEVIDSPFIPSSSKNDYCNKLAELGLASAIKDNFIAIEESVNRVLKEGKSYSAVVMSSVLGIGTAAAVMSVNVMSTMTTYTPDPQFASLIKTVIIPAATVITATAAISSISAMSGYFARRRAKEKTREADLEENSTPKSWDGGIYKIDE